MTLNYCKVASGMTSEEKKTLHLITQHRYNLFPFPAKLLVTSPWGSS